MHKGGNNPQECAIDRNFENGSCLTINELHHIANDYNKKFDNKIKLHNNKEKMIIALQEKLQEYCPNQTCWATLKFVENNEKLREAFRPDGPTEQFGWLSTNEINSYMEGAMKKYKDFLFVGAVPIDIRDLDQFGVKELNYNELIKRNKTKIGIIFNLDEHYKSGSHWVSFYIDFTKKRIYFSDSAGKPPPIRVKELVKHIAENYFHNGSANLPAASYMSTKGKNKLEELYDIRFNKVQHQFGSSECGVYSINFIVRLLRGNSFDTIHGGRVPDENINVCRKKYFNGYDKKIKLNDNLNIC